MLTRTEAIQSPTLARGNSQFLLSLAAISRALKRSIPELALVGADLHLNRLTLIRPTVKQSACLVGVCVSSHRSRHCYR